jgi:hypothetical protein
MLGALFLIHLSRFLGLSGFAVALSFVLTSLPKAGNPWRAFHDSEPVIVQYHRDDPHAPSRNRPLVVHAIRGDPRAPVDKERVEKIFMSEEHWEVCLADLFAKWMPGQSIHVTARCEEPLVALHVARRLHRELRERQIVVKTCP